MIHPTLPPDLDRDRLPGHVAVIMDGNGRWATRQGLPRMAGHRQGAKTLKALLRCCKDWGIGELTAYAFSTENWQRPLKEVKFLLRLFERMLHQEIGEMQRAGVRIRFIGDLTPLPATLATLMQEAMDRTAANQVVRFNVAVNYGGRAELVNAFQQLAAQVACGQLAPNEIQELTIEQHLYTAGSPAPDLLIRTSGEQRLSNYLLWQLAYAELYFTDCLWPEFGQEAFAEALRAFQRRDRRFGGLPTAHTA